MSGLAEMAGPAPAVERPDPVEVMRREHRRVEDDLWKALIRHGTAHGCALGGGASRNCDLDELLNRQWAQVREMSFAIDWVLGKVEMRFGASGFPYEAWAFEYYAGPWPTLSDGTVVK